MSKLKYLIVAVFFLLCSVKTQAKTINNISTTYLNTIENSHELKGFSLTRNHKKKANFKNAIASKSTAYERAFFETNSKIEKKEERALLQRILLAEENLITQKQNYQLNGFVVLVLVVFVFIYLFYKQYKLKTLQITKEYELNEALTIIKNQKRLEKQRLSVFKDLQESISSKLTFIILSIDNLKHEFSLSNDLETKLESISQHTSTAINQFQNSISAMHKS